MTSKRQSLGKGLDALLGLDEGTDAVSLDALSPHIDGSGTSNQDSALQELPVEFLQRGEYQPRKDLNPDALQELANSIAVQGVIQPIVVRPVADSRYEIIAGERRWRAAQQAGLHTVPAIVRSVTDEATIAMALIENIQREDLNAMEESLALIRLQNEFKLTQKQVAEAVGKSRSAVTNLMRLASLETPVQQQLERGELELGHAKCLLALEGNEQINAARNVAANGMTVRQTESLVKTLLNPSNSKGKTTTDNPDIVRLQEDLSEKLGAQVNIQHSAKGSGRLILKYNSVDELDGILAHLK
ncbi:MAG: ParB/RepB/Spo0J family partition protein [Porticoccaceae bacterium]|nr:ParB/RepB/Spo0J family partition protein [Porticoccaceae bacterium]